MFSSILLHIEPISVNYIQVNIKRAAERRSVVSYNFCLCGEAFPDPVRVETRKILLFIDKYQIPNFEINKIINNNQESVSNFLKELIALELTDEIQIYHIFNKAISIYNNYNGDTIDYHTICPSVSGA